MADAKWRTGQRNGLDVVELVTPASTCTIALHGAQVLSFAPRQADDRDWLWVSHTAHFAIGKALRGGIPICFPWFGPHPAGGGLPAHGFARTRLWRLSGVDAADATRVRAELELASDADTLRVFPHPFTARLAVTAGGGRRRGRRPGRLYVRRQGRGRRAPPSGRRADTFRRRSRSRLRQQRPGHDHRAGARPLDPGRGHGRRVDHRLEPRRGEDRDAGRHVAGRVQRLRLRRDRQRR